MKKSKTAKKATTSKVKHSSFRHSKNSRGMKLLYHPSTVILTGKYAGMTFGYILERFGKSAFPELLKYYRISSTIMANYHCTLKPHTEETQAVAPTKESASVSLRDETPVTVNANVTNKTDKVLDSSDVLDMADRVDLDDNKWKKSRFDYENDVLYDPEDDMPDSCIEDLMVA